MSSREATHGTHGWARLPPSFVLEIAAREDCLCELVDASSRTATVFIAADNSITLREHTTLDGGLVLPEFTLSLRELFAELDRHG